MQEIECDPKESPNAFCAGQDEPAEEIEQRRHNHNNIPVASPGESEEAAATSSYMGLPEVHPVEEDEAAVVTVQECSGLTGAPNDVVPSAAAKQTAADVPSNMPPSDEWHPRCDPVAEQQPMDDASHAAACSSSSSSSSEGPTTAGGIIAERLAEDAPAAAAAVAAVESEIVAAPPDSAVAEGTQPPASPSLSGLFTSLAGFWGSDGLPTSNKRRKLNGIEDQETSASQGHSGIRSEEAMSSSRGDDETPPQTLAVSPNLESTRQCGARPPAYLKLDSARWTDTKDASSGPPSITDDLMTLRTQLRNSLLPVAIVQPWLRLVNLVAGIMTSDGGTAANSTSSGVPQETLASLQEASTAVGHLPDALNVRRLLTRLTRSTSTTLPAELSHVLSTCCAEPDEQTVIVGVIGSPVFLQFAQSYLRYASVPKTQAAFLADFRRLYLILAASRLTAGQQHDVPISLAHATESGSIEALPQSCRSKIREIFLRKYCKRLYPEETAAQLFVAPPTSPKRGRPRVRNRQSTLARLSPEDLVLLLQRMMRQFDTLDANQLSPMVAYLSATSNPNKRLVVQRFIDNIQAARVLGLSRDALIQEIDEIQETVRLLRLLPGPHRTVADGIAFIDDLFPVESGPLLGHATTAPTATGVRSRRDSTDEEESEESAAANETIATLRAHLRGLHVRLAELEFAVLDGGSATLDDFLVTAAVSSMALQLFYDATLNGKDADSSAEALLSGGGGGKGPAAPAIKTETTIRAGGAAPAGGGRRRRGRPATKRGAAAAAAAAAASDVAAGSGGRRGSGDEVAAAERTSSEDDATQDRMKDEGDEEFHISYRNGVPQSGRRGVIWHQAGRAWDATWAAMGKQQHKLFYVKDLGMRGALEAAIRFRQDVERTRLRC